MNNQAIPGLSSGSRKTRIETGKPITRTLVANCLSSGSRKTRIETYKITIYFPCLVSLSSGSRKTRIETGEKSWHGMKAQ